jgi:SAM-dependent methyltransferase
MDLDLCPVALGQHGRASIDFLASFTKTMGGKVEPMVKADIAKAGITEDNLADDLDARLAQMETALADSDAFHLKNLAMEWSSVNHGLTALAAFEEIRPEIEPVLKALQTGPATIETFPHFTPPDYLDGVWIHRTHGGWDGHEYQGFIHGEMIHKRYLWAMYPSPFDARRAVLDLLPRKDYRRIFEMGVSSGYHTLCLADAFPEAEISGCDVSRPMLEQAQRHANRRNLPWKLYVGRGEDTRLPAGSFDLVSSFILLHELPADMNRAFFAEAYRLLEPGGNVIMTDVPPYKAQDKMTTWKFDRGGIRGGEPYWREAGLVDTVEIAKEIGFVNVSAARLPGGGNYWVTIAQKPL